ncbi:hypothetical protein [Sinorhizobium meliloti]|uniref:hypothetical protein n=1 Tax=Rhizobium meliloti TaxID=382 RepID=UPI001F188083|nr:hypothetical protein [Sinorhizobium meliloti]
MQVKYEMLRRASIDKVSVTEASDEYGVSRPTYCQAKVNLWPALPDWCRPRSQGPASHKIDDKVVAFLQAHLAPGETVRARELAKLLRQELDIELHPTSIERVLKKAAGRHCRDGGMPDPTVHHLVRTRYCARQLSAQRRRLWPVAACCSFCAGACGDGLRR